MDAPVWYRWEGHSEYFCLVKLSVVKETPCGFVLDYYGKRKFVLKDSRKKFAYPTEVEAEANFLKRRTKYIQILQARLDQAIEDLRVFQLPRHREENVSPFSPPPLCEWAGA